MQIVNVSCGVKGFVRLSEYAIRFAYMITKEAKERIRILNFWHKHGLPATKEAFKISRSSLFAWQKLLGENKGRLEALNPGKTRPKKVRCRKYEWSPFVLEEIKRLREAHPNLGADKVHVFLLPWCQKEELKCPSARTVARLIKDLGGLRKFPEKVRHSGEIVRRKREKAIRKPKFFHSEYPGHLVSLDSIERNVLGSRRYIITATDTFSRFSFALATNSHASLAAKDFFMVFRQVFPIPIKTILTDNGSEFKKNFAQCLREECLTHWKTYPKCPKMNTHSERFNRTIQEEFVDYHAGDLLDIQGFNQKMLDYLLWYNGERPHWGLKLKTPVEVLVHNKQGLSRMSWRNT